MHKKCPNQVAGKLMPCACGCGKTYVKEKYSRRKYAEGCATAYQRWLDTKRAAAQRDPSKRPKKPLRGKLETCLICFNLPHRREGICGGCGLPEAPDTSPLGEPHQCSAIALCEAER